MSNDVVAYAAAPPRLPARLQSQVATVLHAEWRPGELPRYDPEAAKALPAFDAACEPADAATIKQWLGALVAAVANPPAQADFRMRVGPVLLALGDLPGWRMDTGNAAAGHARIQVVAARGRVGRPVATARRSHHRHTRRAGEDREGRAAGVCGRSEGLRSGTTAGMGREPSRA